MLLKSVRGISFGNLYAPGRSGLSNAWRNGSTSQSRASFTRKSDSFKRHFLHTFHNSVSKSANSRCCAGLAVSCLFGVVSDAGGTHKTSATSNFRQTPVKSLGRISIISHKLKRRCGTRQEFCWTSYSQLFPLFGDFGGCPVFVKGVFFPREHPN